MQSAIIKRTIPFMINPTKTNLNFISRFGNILLNSLSKTTIILSYSTMPEASNQNQSSSEAESSRKVYVQRNLEKDIITISFQYTSDEKSKSFNLSRNTREPISFALERIKLNLCKLNKRSYKIKTQALSVDQLKMYNVDLTINGLSLDPLTKNIDAWIEGAVLEVNGKPYHIRTDDPQVELIKLPSCIMKNFIIMPIVNLLNCNIDNCKFAWYRQISAKERENIIQLQGNQKEIVFDGRSYWYKLSSEFTYCPTNEDVAHYLKIICWPSDGVNEGPESIFISSNPVELGPSNCPFEKRHSHTQNILSNSSEFRLVTYNILADLYADSDYSRSVLFGHCPSHALDLNYRRQLLLKEIKGYNADLICLQEVDKKEFLRTYEPFFNLMGNYSVNYDTKGGQVAEGLATFYRNDKLELIDSHKTLLVHLIEPIRCVAYLSKDLDKCGYDAYQGSHCIKKPHLIVGDLDSFEAKKCFSKFDKIRQAILSNQKLKKRFFDRHTVLQTTLLKFKDSVSNFIIVANTHLYFAPDADHIRLLQGCVCVKYLEYIKDFYKQMLIYKFDCPEPNISVIFCGDMNSTPDCGLYKLLTEGKVAHDLPDWSSNKDEAVVGLSVETYLRFSSAYRNIEYTNYTPEFKGCLDYIYYEQGSLICDSTVPVPDHEDVSAICGIPSEVFPSDHLALIANLNISDNRSSFDPETVVN